MMSVNIFSEVMGVERVGDEMEVEVVVGGLKTVTSATKDLRARSLAIYETGATDVASRTLGDITAGEIERLTSIEDKEIVDDEAMLDEVVPSRIGGVASGAVEAYRYTIRVKTE